MGLFGKKYCDICGAEIGLLGNRKLENGNCCKTCAAKLSPWFDGRKHATVDQIKSQLEYRESNKKNVAKFEKTYEVPTDKYRFLFNSHLNTFMITSAKDSDLLEANPDVLTLAMIRTVSYDVPETKTEILKETKDFNGDIKRVSYSPKRYNYGYDFTINIKLDHPYFDEIEFKLNDLPVKFEGQNFAEGFEGDNDPRMADSDYANYMNAAKCIVDVLNGGKPQPYKKFEPNAAPATAKPAEKMPVRDIAFNTAEDPVLKDNWITFILQYPEKNIYAEVPIQVSGTCGYSIADKEKYVAVKPSDSVILARFSTGLKNAISTETMNGQYGLPNELPAHADDLLASDSIKNLSKSLCQFMGITIESLKIEKVTIKEDSRKQVAQLLGIITQAKASEEWTCTSCGNKNTGNFCSICGSKRP